MGLIKSFSNVFSNVIAGGAANICSELGRSLCSPKIFERTRKLLL